MGTSKITETSRVTNGNWLTLVAPCTCPGCRRCSGSCQNLTDVPDGLCASCRAWRTCDDLVEGVRNTLEKFFDARYQRHDGTGNYYSDEPAPEFDLAYDQILGAIDETCGGIKKLIELAPPAEGGHVAAPGAPWRRGDLLGCTAGRSCSASSH